MQSNLALRDRRINNFIEKGCLVASRGLKICVSSTSFQKNDIGWPQQPLTEGVSYISEKLDFWWTIPQKGTGIGHLSSRDDEYFFLMKWGCWGHLGHWGCWAIEVIEISPGKSLLKTSVSSRSLNSALLWSFEEKKMGVESGNIILNFSTLSVWGC